MLKISVHYEISFFFICHGEHLCSGSNVDSFWLPGTWYIIKISPLPKYSTTIYFTVRSLNDPEIWWRASPRETQHTSEIKGHKLIPRARAAPAHTSWEATKMTKARATSPSIAVGGCGERGRPLECTVLCLRAPSQSISLLHILSSHHHCSLSLVLNQAHSHGNIQR